MRSVQVQLKAPFVEFKGDKQTIVRYRCTRVCACVYCMHICTLSNKSLGLMTSRLKIRKEQVGRQDSDRMKGMNGWRKMRPPPKTIKTSDGFAQLNVNERATGIRNVGWDVQRAMFGKEKQAKNRSG